MIASRAARPVSVSQRQIAPVHQAPARRKGAPRHGIAPIRRPKLPEPREPKAPEQHACGPGRAWDFGLEQVFHLAPWVPELPKAAEALAEQRRKAADKLVERLLPAVRVLAPKIEAGDAAAIRDYDVLMDAAVQALRHDKDGSWRDAWVELDNHTFHQGTEISDDPATPMQTRLNILDTLHRFNIATRSYKRWGDMLAPWVREQPAGVPLSVVDLAGGTGGYAVALKERFGAAARVKATDLENEFLSLGRAEAEARGVDVEFARQDVFDLKDLRGTGVDVFTCTQSLHHFTPGQLGRMMGEARASARRGLCFVDGERGMLVTALVTLSMAMYGRDYPVVHDTYVSLCRMYVAEEIGLLARLAPGVQPTDRIEAGRLAPGHLYLQIEKA